MFSVSIFNAEIWVIVHVCYEEVGSLALIPEKQKRLVQTTSTGLSKQGIMWFESSVGFVTFLVVYVFCLLTNSILANNIVVIVIFII